MRTFANRVAGKLLWKLLRYLPYAQIPHQVLRFRFPSRIEIEPTSVCNLECPLCETPRSRRKKGRMSLDDFTRIIDEVRGRITRCNMGLFGEPLLNTDIFKMVRYAESAGIRIRISTNATLLDRYIDELFSSRLTQLVVCLDGASKETHEAYRVGSKFETVRDNIRLVCAEKAKRAVEYPHIKLQFVVMKHNEHEMGKIEGLARELGVDTLSLKSTFLPTSLGQEQKIHFAKEYLPQSLSLSRFILKDGTVQVKFRPNVCHWIKSSVIQWNGDVTMCCHDYHGELVVGNVFRDGGFQKVWESESYRRARKSVVRREYELCRNCNMSDKVNIRNRTLQLRDGH